MILRGTRKNRVKPPFSFKYFLIVRILIPMLIIFTLSVIGISIVEQQLRPQLMTIAKSRVKQIATEALNASINKKIAENINYLDMIQIERDESEMIRNVILDYSKLARVAGEATATVESTIGAIKKERLELPLGQALNSNILAQLGPKLPIIIEPRGNVKVDITRELENAGINMVLLSIYMQFTVEIRVILPFATEPEVITSQIPIHFSLIVGEVPHIYLNYGDQGSGGGNTQIPLQSPISIPIN
ncbi:sporulation protein YunB [Rubeoparvulum massiliense]|uniref:sporulation protein YunB n=1 Tax=Rubeoparvulum massiliense TaxID=1631346 RepID=UPI00065E480A|nr:sporulation protein YunB [Rubeoparvulum massiliense]